MSEDRELKDADKLACEIIELFRSRKLGLRESMLTTALMLGRLRHQAAEAGINLSTADALFMFTAKTITEAIEVAPEGKDKSK